MKTTFLKQAVIAVMISTFFVGCVKDSDYDVPNTDCIETSLVKTKEVNQIPAGLIVAQYVYDDVIEAYVTSSDRGGNFYKSISFQTLDGSAGFSVPVDVTNTYVNFEPGRKVLIKMKDLYTDSPTLEGPIGMRIGGLYIDPQDGSSAVGRLNFSQFGKVLNRSCTVVNEDDLVKTVTINQAKSDAYINRLVEIENVQFGDDAIGKTYYDENNEVGGATNYDLQDKDGNSIIFRTSSFATYSGNLVSSKRGKVRGIITKYNSDYQLIIRTESDLKLDGPRLLPLFEESFTNNFPLWNKISEVGTQVWTLDTQYGNPGSCAKISGFANSANNNNEDWLISPVINLSSVTTAFLSFDNAYKFSGNPIQVYLSNNYSGSGSPYASGVTWTEVTGATLSAGNYAWTNSGLLNISSFTGVTNSNVYLAFKYTSTTSGSSTWEIDNVKIINE